ncbi:sigma-54 interaction domain-containing protein [Metabacillus sediminilitoris]|uniref:PAS domain S-box protein n=1 Tax=Metabacillus sediminilitoris TaxID=2567941 RepID=A0A4S4C0B3_9BACI|nr:sigma-54-dependent Fis family transcriptional regulator [Metabacillus sediminilitoris]QGQ47155.1 PAS domain S-box protein [Metabacillus sediminilitoris]THF80499.1 PAS domain S-box protein [Metabacillus sediminilitoris]
MQRVLIVGAGKGGTALLRRIIEKSILEVVAIVDLNNDAPGMKLARKLGVATRTEWTSVIKNNLNIIIDATGNDKVIEQLEKQKAPEVMMIPSTVAHIIFELIEEKEELITRLKEEAYKQQTIFNSTNDGMIVIDLQEKIILFNKRAEEMTEYPREKALGQKINDVISSSKLARTLSTREIELNQEQVLENGLKIITTRIPLIDEAGNLLGALSLFKDITEVVHLAEEVTNLKDIQVMLEAIIQSSEEAISVVDEEGHGLLINRAYTKMTGLTKEQIIGKPATADISEGESMHMKVLQTRRPVRGVRMKVGPAKRDVIVNVAPVIVNGKLKGSVGVIHDMSEIQTLTTELSRARQIIRTLEAKYSFEDIIGISEEMKMAIEQAKLGAKTPATVLLRGESGTGKELFAHAIHNASDRKYNKFIRVNCAAISETLLESELFGYEEGAFSGAKRGGKRGYFEEANNGSIFLDEIGELSANMQAKLLRVLQENEIVKVGGTKPLQINVRVIAATNINIEKAMSEGRFREDLYYRLNRYPISIPPLRDRKEDIRALCERLISKLNQVYGRNIESVTPQAIDILNRYDWPGNVRELENVLARAIIFMEHHESVIDATHIPVLEISPNERKIQQNISIVHNNEETLAEAVERVEAEVIKNSLEIHEYNRTKTAKALGISLRSLYYKMEKYNLANNSMQ